MNKFRFLLLPALSFVGIFCLQAQLSPPAQEHVLRFSLPVVAIAPASALLNLGADFTSEAWVFPQDYRNAWILSRSLDSECDISYVLRLSDGGSKPEFVQSLGTWDSYRSIMAPDSIKLNKWTHLACTLSGGIMKLYVNGVLVGMQDSPGDPVNGSIPFSVGNSLSPVSLPYGNGLCGAISQVRIWNRALSADELTSQAGMYLAGNESGLVAYWPCDDGTGTIARDHTVNQLDLQLFFDVGNQLLPPRWALKSILDGGPYFQIKENIFADAAPGMNDGRFIDVGNDGSMDFLATQFNWPPDSARMVFLKNDGSGNFTIRNDLILNRDHCYTMHPRFIITNDFNNDGLTDYFIADHGRDDGAGTGGLSMLVLQTADGKLDWHLRDKIPQRMAFTHYATSGDIDNDGDADIYMSNVNCRNWLKPDIGTPAITHNLYVVIRHRNHLAVMSATGATLSSGVYSYDFTTGPAQAYGGGSGYKMAGSKAVMVTGDIDQDGSVFVTDYNGWATGFGSTLGYFISDLDMDSNVYVTDYNKWAANFGSTILGWFGLVIKPIYFSGVPDGRER